MLFTGSAVVVPAVIHEIDSVVDRRSDQAGALCFTGPSYVVAAQTDYGNFFTGPAEVLVWNAVPFFHRPEIGPDRTHRGDSRGDFQEASTRNLRIAIKR